MKTETPEHTKDTNMAATDRSKGRHWPSAAIHALAVVLMAISSSGCATRYVRWRKGERIPPAPFETTSYGLSSLAGAYGIMPYAAGEPKYWLALPVATVLMIADLPISCAGDLLLLPRDQLRLVDYKGDIAFWDQFILEADREFPPDEDLTTRISQYTFYHLLHSGKIHDVPFSESRIDALIESGFLLGRLARNPALNHRQARVLASVDQQRIKNPYSSESIQYGLEENPSTPPELLDAYARGSHPFRTAANPSLPVATIEWLAQRYPGDRHLAESLAHNPSCPRKVLEQCRQMDDQRVNCALLLNPALPDDMLDELIKIDSLCHVALGVTSASPTALWRLLQAALKCDPKFKKDIVWRIAYHKNATPEIIRAAWQSGLLKPDLVARLENTPTDVLDDVAVNFDGTAYEDVWLAAYCLIQHRNCTPKALEIIRVKVEAEIVRLTALDQTMRRDQPEEWERQRYKLAAQRSHYEAVLKNLERPN